MFWTCFVCIPTKVFLLFSSTTRKSTGRFEGQKQAHWLYYPQHVSQPDNKALKDKQKWWYEQSRGLCALASSLSFVWDTVLLWRKLYFTDTTVSQVLIYTCVHSFPPSLHIYSWHRDSPPAVCNGKVLQCQHSHCHFYHYVWPWAQQERDNER